MICELGGAKSPILLTSYAGRTPGASEAILKLAEFAGIRVYEANMVSNISHDSPCFCGFQAGPAIGQADVGLLVDVDVPWFPRDTRASEGTFWAQIDLDVVKGGSPMWSFPSSLRLQGNSGRILEQVLEAMKAKATPAFQQAAAARVAQFAAENAKRLERAAELAANPGEPGAINAHYLCRELGKRIAPEDVIFSEATRNTPAVQQQIMSLGTNLLMVVPGATTSSMGRLAASA